MPFQFDLVIISAEDLETKTQSRVIVSIIHKDHNNNNNNSLFEQQTPMVTHGDFTNPEWNSAMCYTIDGFAAFQGLLTLVAKVKAGNEVVGNDLIGEVRVNIKDLLEVLGENHLTYVVRKPSGEAMGVLNFSCKFKELMTYPVGQAAPLCSLSHAALASAPPAAVKAGPSSTATAMYPLEERYYTPPLGYVWNQGFAPPPPTPYPAVEAGLSGTATAIYSPEERYYMPPPGYGWNQGFAPPPPTPYPAPQTNIVCSLAQKLGIAIFVELLKMAVLGDLSL